MQATGTFGGARLSKRAAATVTALIAALAIGGAGGYVAKSEAVGQSAPRVGAVQLAPQAVGSYDSYRSVRGGLQTGDTSANTVASGGSGSGDSCIWVNGQKGC